MFPNSFMPLSHKSFDRRRFFAEIRRTVSAFGMLEKQDAVLVAVSGGPDSVALLYVLLALAPAFQLRLGVAHLNHGLRPVPLAQRDQALAKKLAAAEGLPFFEAHADTGAYQRAHRLSPEDAARRLRYRFLNRIASENAYHKIALGHQADDNAEQVLMSVIRGSGLQGLAGIPPRRGGKLIRPLIRTRRTDLLAFLKAEQRVFVSDETNRDTGFLRNRVRQDLLPRLENSYNPGIRAALNRLSEILRAENDALAADTQRSLDRVVIAKASASMQLSIQQLKELPLAARRRVLLHVFFGLQQRPQRIGLRHIQAANDLIETGPPAGRYDLPGRIRLERRKEHLIIRRSAEPLRSARAPSPVYRYTIEKPGTLHIEPLGAWLRLSETVPAAACSRPSRQAHIAFFDRDALAFPLTVRSPRPGDRFRPLGLDGSQALKKFFSSRRVPAGERWRWPLLLSGSEIVWVVGQRISETAKLTGCTRKVMQGEFFLPNR